jgi:mRNA interferase RelE/StbE
VTYSYSVLITETCLSLIASIVDKKIQRAILKRIEKLADSPAQQGKRLVRDLEGFRSVHAAGRYRIIYKVEEQRVIVYVLAAGIRKEGAKKDVYELAKRLLRAGLLEPGSR